MLDAAEVKRSRTWIAIFCLALGLLYTSAALAGEAPPAPEMPAGWKIISDWSVPAQQETYLSNLFSSLPEVYYINSEGSK